ncbi:unnamed protein product [Pedinophyceae sp. YPF-701]|nr:unnamed protein product [Pedinophyceae sp. YPF-701]
MRSRRWCTSGSTGALSRRSTRPPATSRRTDSSLEFRRLVLELMMACRTAATVRDGSARVAAGGDAAAVGATLLVPAAPTVVRCAWRGWPSRCQRVARAAVRVRALLELTPARKPRAVAEAWTWLRAPLRVRARRRHAPCDDDLHNAALDRDGGGRRERCGGPARPAAARGRPDGLGGARVGRGDQRGARWGLQNAAGQFGKDITSLAALLSSGLEAEVQLSAGYQLLLLARAGRLDGRSARPEPMLLGRLQLARAPA